MRSAQLHRSKVLENLSVAYTPAGYIADALSPKFMVTNETDTYYVYSKDVMGLPETIRADGAEANRAHFNLSTATYNLDFHGLKDFITDRQRRNADKAISLDSDLTEYLTGVILLRREVDLQSIVQTAANWANTTSLSSTQAWSLNTTTSNPITFVDSASSVVLVNSSRKPNTVVMNDQVFNDVKEHGQLVDRVKYTSRDSIGPDIIARLFNVGKVLVPEISYNTADEGIADSMTRVWNDNVFIGYVEPNPGLKKISALYTFWQKQTGMPYTVKKYREEKLESDVIEVNAGFQNKVIASDCAYLIVDAH